MSVRIKIDDPNTGRHYEVEVPLTSIAATCAQTPYQETQQMVSDFTHRTVQACVGGSPEYYDPRPTCRATVEIIDRRLLDSCYVQRATGKEALQDPESLVIGVHQPGRVFWYICKKYTPLRRVLNAYAAEREKDVKLFQLTWEGDMVSYHATAEDVSSCCGSVNLGTVTDEASSSLGLRAEIRSRLCLLPGVRFRGLSLEARQVRRSSRRTDIEWMVLRWSGRVAASRGRCYKIAVAMET